MAKFLPPAVLIAFVVSGCVSQRAERAQLYTSEAEDDIYCRGLGYRAESPAYIDCRLSARRQMATGQAERVAAFRRVLESGGR